MFYFWLTTQINQQMEVLIVSIPFLKLINSFDKKIINFLSVHVVHPEVKSNWLSEKQRL